MQESLLDTLKGVYYAGALDFKEGKLNTVSEAEIQALESSKYAQEIIAKWVLENYIPKIDSFKMEDWAKYYGYVLIKDAPKYCKAKYRSKDAELKPEYRNL